MTGALLLLACFCYLIDPATIPPPPWLPVASNASADVDPMLAELRALSVKVDRLEMKGDARDAKLDNVHDGMVELTAAVKGKNQLIDEDHVTLTHPTTGVVVRQTKMESSQTRHSRFLWGLAGIVGTVVGGVATASMIKRLGLRNGKNGNAKRT